MRNLRELSRAELGEWTPRQRFRFALAVGLALSAMVLALFGQMWRYPAEGAETPLPGMDQLAGQIGWSVLLGVLMIVAAWMMRGVVMMRLQMAIVFSLLIHLCLMLMFQRITLAVPIAHVTETPRNLDDEPEQLTLPDYGGMEAPDAERQNWQLPDDTATPDVQLEAQQRAEIEHNVELERERREVEHQTEVARHEQMQRQQREQQVELDNMQASIDRQRIEQELQAPAELQAPEVETRESRERMELNEQVEMRKEQTVPATERRQQRVQRQDRRNPEALRLEANRSEQSPQSVQEQLQAEQQRAFAAARAAETRAEPTEVASVDSARQMTAQQQAVEAARQAAAGLPGRSEALESAPSGARTSTPSNSRAPTRAATGGVPQSAPSGGGAAQIARSQTGGSVSGAAAQADSVQVAAAAAGSGPAVSSASAAAEMSTRGSRSSVPSRNSGSGAAAVSGGRQSVGSAALPGGASGRPTAGGGSPNVGSGPGLQATGRGDTGRRVAAVGTNAGSVDVAAAASGGGTGGSGIAAGGPTDTTVNRSSTGLPSGSGRASGTAPAATGSDGAGRIRGSVGSGLASRGTEPSARLGSATGGGTASGVRSSITGRSNLTPALPEAMVRAEQAGSLTTAGPTAAGSTGGATALSGPRIASLPRRSAGLPGSASGSGASRVTGSRSTRPSTSSGGGLTARRSTSDGPSLEARNLIAGLLKRSGGANLQAAESRIPETFAMRRQQLRGKIAETLGGSEASERAVEAGLDWLARHQGPDGQWSIHAFHENCKDHKCTAPGSFRTDTAATGLALLAFYGAGYTHTEGKHEQTVRRGLDWLLKGQKQNGDLFQDETEFVWFYSHGMAAIALCEAYGLTRDPELREPAQKAVNFIVESQHPEFGGWRYRPQFESDTSVSGWQLMALKSGEISGLSVPKHAYEGVSRWLDSVETKTRPGHFSYHPTKPESIAMSAEALLMRQYLGASHHDANLQAGADFLLEHLPDMAERDAYYWYYGTQVMFHLQDEHWEQWNARLRDMLVGSQLKDGGPGGSWNPDRPTKEKWGAAGGRLYVTCLNLLMLEVYYRHLPLYQLNKPDGELSQRPPRTP